eukprot:scaffold4484_cov115-Pinguiococcus_pyrenoidosus.AAC.1
MEFLRRLALGDFVGGTFVPLDAGLPGIQVPGNWAKQAVQRVALETPASAQLSSDAGVALPRPGLARVDDVEVKPKRVRIKHTCPVSACPVVQ